MVAACGSAGPASEGGRLYVASGATDDVVVLDAATGAALRTVPVDPRPSSGDEPHGVAVAPDGGHWYVTVSHGEAALWKLDARDDVRVGRLLLGTRGAARIGITPDGERAFVPDYWRSGRGEPSGLAVVDPHDLRILGTPTVCPAPHDARPDPSGRLVAVTCSLGDEVAYLDAASGEVVARAPAGPDPGPAGSPAYRPLNAAWSPDGERVYVTLAGSGELLVLDRSAEEVERVDVGGGPMQIAHAGEAGPIAVALRQEGALALVDPAGREAPRRIDLPDAPHPHGLTTDPEGERAFVGFEGTVDTPGGVVAVALPEGEILWRSEFGSYVLGVAYRPGR